MPLKHSSYLNDCKLIGFSASELTTLNQAIALVEQTLLNRPWVYGVLSWDIVHGQNIIYQAKATEDL